jgi:hypothetical protein
MYCGDGKIKGKRKKPQGQEREDQQQLTLMGTGAAGLVYR